MSQPPATNLDPIELSWRSSWAHHAIIKQISRNLSLPTERKTDSSAQVPIGAPGITEEHIPRLSLNVPEPKTNDPLKVAIVGAGCAGLFVPMIFNKLSALLEERELPNLSVKCEIFEASAEARLGGRVYTHKFSQGGPHDYYDVGAMRFPEVKIMNRTFDLFTKELKMPNVDILKPDTPAGSLVPYIYKPKPDTPNQPSYFNDVQYLAPPDPDEVDPYSIPGIPLKLSKLGPGKVLSNVVKHFTDLLNDNPAKGWERLMEYDKCSTRQVLYQPLPWMNDIGDKETLPPYDYNTVEWLETFNSGTRWFDQAFSETVLEESVFDPGAKWWCIMGGTQQVAKMMLEKIMKDSPGTTIRYDSLVTAIGIDSVSPTSDPKAGPHITVGGQTTSYDSVFNSVPLGCMRRMDLRKLPLAYGTKQALRSLNYGSSTKVGMRFKNMWWRNDRFNIRGGLGKTDLPLRVCVYPSYNLEDPPEDGGVLLCSYCWAQDADRTGALIDNDGSDKEKLQKLQDTLVHNLTLLHCRAGDQADYDAVRKLIMGDDNSNLQEMHAFDWTRNELSTGAFAYFGPGQFTNMLPDILSTDGRHIIIGELASAHHAWIVGALESAVRGVYMFLLKRALKGHEGCQAALKLYNDNAVPSPYGPVPPEFSRSTYLEDLDNESVEEPVIGELAMYLTILESHRLEAKAAAVA